MTLPSGGNLPPLSIADIQAEFSRGNNLNAYRGTSYFNPDNSTSYFPAGIIRISDFYGTAKNSPVVPGNITVTSGTNLVLPTMFNQLYITCYGAGGGGGQGGKCTSYGGTTAGASGNGGGSTYFMSGTSFAVSAQGGGGGGGGNGIVYNALGGVAAGGNGSPGSTGSGGGGGGGGGAGSGTGGPYNNGASYPYTLTEYGSSGGNGGQGGNSGEILVMDINTMGWASIRNYYNATVSISIGSGGGTNFNYGAGYGGNNGGGGWIYLRWT